MTALADLLACPRCDKTPLETSDDSWHCKACKIHFPSIDGIPWMFAEPEAALGEWRGRLRFAVQKLAQEVATLDQELKSPHISALAKRRVERYRKCVDSHRRKLQKLLRPVDLQSLQGNYESYLALRTRLPTDQGLNTYYANIHRDWAWGDEENEASLKQIGAVLHDHAELGKVLVLGAGAGRLAYDIHTRFDCSATIAMDFNPLLLLVARAVTRGEKINLYEFPIAPLALEDDAVLRKLAAPEVVDDNFHLVLADALRPPFPEGTFDTVVTPWLIDIITEDLPVFAARINRLLKKRAAGSTSARSHLPHRNKRAATAPKRSRRLLARAVSPIPTCRRQPSLTCARRQAGTVARNASSRFPPTRNETRTGRSATRRCPIGW
jgi:uncharacterized protein YbaR (Trm112 family)/ubiquinone/menaquinone biosynthesis C-methylase UbiE